MTLPAPRRVVAALAALWLVACSAIGAHHAAARSHAFDARTGQLVHTAQLIGAHDRNAPADVHRDAGDDDHGACELLAALSQPATASSPLAVAPVIAASAIVHARPAIVDAAFAAAIYRLAPKTSPPPIAARA